MSNRKMGNAFESIACKILFDNGFWVHNMAQNQAGQPADIIAVKDGKAYLIDAKVCSNKRFDLIRIESNQHSAMTMWEKRGNGTGWFLLLVDGSMMMISYDDMKKAIENEMVSLSLMQILFLGTELTEWLKNK